MQILKIAPQLSQRPQQTNIPAFDNFEVITQGNDGELLKMLRVFLTVLPDDHSLRPDVEVLLDMLEKGVVTVAKRACDTSKRNCQKNDDGSLIFPSDLNHFAMHSDDYLQMAKAWSEVKRYIKDAEWKFTEDQRRIDEAMNDKKLENKR